MRKVLLALAVLVAISPAAFAGTTVSCTIAFSIPKEIGLSQDNFQSAQVDNVKIAGQMQQVKTIIAK